MKKTLIIGVVALSLTGIASAAPLAHPSSQNGLTSKVIDFDKMTDILNKQGYVITSLQRNEDGFKAEGFVRKNGFPVELSLDNTGKLLPGSAQNCLHAMSISEASKMLEAQGYFPIVKAQVGDDEKCTFKVVAVRNKDGKKTTLDVPALVAAR